MTPGELCFFVPSNYRNRHGSRKGPWWGMNEIMQSQRTYGKRTVDRQKLGAETHVARIARAAMEEQGWQAPEGRCEVILTFVEMGRSRDPDNIFGGAKYILDALCEPTFMRVDKRSGKEVWKHRSGCGAIHDDSQRYVTLRCAIAERTDRQEPGVWVRLKEEVSGS